MEVDLDELPDHEIQQFGLVERTDLGVEVEMLDDVADLWGEPGDMGPQVVGDVIWVVQQVSPGRTWMCSTSL